ncbi:flagellar hook-associated protein FlgK [Lachnospiraceae bacterium HCP1S3_C3]|nr:flagellar hook-associated protein FlgK [Lachnospiraceae bacterium]MDD6858099.1 flagellar hook-associated protein FlgK [Lachnospiraceae bacterium]
MASTFFGLDIGKTGLFAAKAGLATTGNNVSNENTKGYSRQVVNQQAKTSLRVYASYGMIGTGVEVTSIERVRDIYYDNKYRSNYSKLGENSTKYSYNIQLEDSFNEMSESGFTTLFADMFASLQELKGTPDDITRRSEFLNYSQSLAEYMNEIKSRLTTVQMEANQEVSNSVSRINLYTDQIASLTKQINIVEMAGGTASELRDQRDNMLDSLSNIVPVNVTETKYENGKTDYLLRVGDFTLVNNYESHKLMLVTREDNNNKYDATGLFDIYYYYDDNDKTGTKFDVQSMNLSGSLRGILDIRDGNNADETSKASVNYKGIPHYINRIQEFKQAIADAFNNVHDKGIDLNGNSTAGVKIFEMSITGELSVNKDLLKNPSLMGATVNPLHQGVSDSSLIDEFLEIRDANILNNSTASEYLESIVTESGVSTQKSKLFEENYTTIVNTSDKQRMSISGVDGDEEAMNLQKYQEAYDICANVITVMTECYDKLINEMGV